MVTEGPTGSMEVVGIVSWGRGEYSFGKFEGRKPYTIDLFRRMCTKIIAWNLHTNRELSRLDQPETRGRMLMSTPQRSPNKLPRKADE